MGRQAERDARKDDRSDDAANREAGDEATCFPTPTVDLQERAL